MTNNKLANENNNLLRKLIVVAIIMFAFGYALVPLYKKICEVTGVYDLIKPDEIVNTQVDESRTVVMEFDANTRSDIGWQLVPLDFKMDVHPGELVHATFRLTNPTDTSFDAQAIPSYGPQHAAQFVKKLECFCFTQQTINAGETRDFSVVFVLDPTLPSDVGTVTLSYTMFEIEGTKIIQDQTAHSDTVETKS
ncbi:cytochrome c oxidase assembly protein [Burkholderiales bacterium]|jgi:cytochrome c oxidase assembly protein subunit 11|nr:cytochrome c oxidase assembly protein [Betaproteobacteria bacterium]MDA9295676.1 cytochrome c oxidase assembly protein [Burkholderiales bacterium]MDC3408573.1 cytochrome c oxidase assembly protein [Burkholderiales bacterium]